MDKMIDTVESLLKKAAEKQDADSAMKFAQAALNAANAINVITHARQAASS